MIGISQVGISMLAHPEVEFFPKGKNSNKKAGGGLFCQSTVVDTDNKFLVVFSFLFFSFLSVFPLILAVFGL